MSAVTKLIYWVDPIKTGAVFGSVLTVLLALSSCSLLSVISHCCLAALMAVLGARLYTFVMVKAGKAQPGEDPLAQVCGASWCLSEDKVGEVSSLLAQGLNNLLPRARSLFLIHNSVESLQLAAGLYFMTYIGAWFNALTLVTLCWLGLFSLPKLYLNNKVQVDEVVAKVVDQAAELKVKVEAVLPASMKPAVVKKEE